MLAASGILKGTTICVCRSFMQERQKPLHPRACGGEGGVVLRPIEDIALGDFVLGHDFHPHAVRSMNTESFRGVAYSVITSQGALWLTPGNYLMSRKRVMGLGGHTTWKHIPTVHFARARKMRQAECPAERKLWHVLRSGSLSAKFRKQHPIGSYIVDFYCREKGLVVEVDGRSHMGEEAAAYDERRDVFLRSLGLNVLHFSDAEVLGDVDNVVAAIFGVIDETMEILPPLPPRTRGGEEASVPYARGGEEAPVSAVRGGGEDSQHVLEPGQVNESFDLTHNPDHPPACGGEGGVAAYHPRHYEWRRVESLRRGDALFPGLTTMRSLICEILTQRISEVFFSLAVDEVPSFITPVATLHDCSTPWHERHAGPRCRIVAQSESAVRGGSTQS